MTITTRIRRRNTNRPLTRTQKEKKAHKWRRFAGELYVDLARGQVDGAALDHLRAAHNALCEAFRALEEQAE